MERKRVRAVQQRRGQSKSKLLVILALGGTAIAIGLLSFVSYKQFYVRRLKNRQLQKIIDDDNEEEDEEEEEVEEVSNVAPPSTVSKANENKIKWWSEIANEQLILGDVKSARFYSQKAIEEMSSDPKFEKSIVMLEMKYILGTTAANDVEKEKLLQNVLSNMERIEISETDLKYFIIKGHVYKDISDICFVKEKYGEAEDYIQKCYDNYKKGFANQPNRLEASLSVSKFSMSTIKDKLNKLEESEADAAEAYQHAVNSKSFQLILHISNHRTDVLTRLGRRDDAIAVIKDQIEDDSFEKPQSFLANRHHSLATLLYDQNNVEEAIENLKQSISLYPKYYPAISLLTSCYFELGQDDEGRKVSEALIESYDILLSQSKYLLSSFVSFNAEREGEPFIFYIDLKLKRNKDEALLLQPGNYLELNIKKFYKNGERPEEEPTIADVQSYTIVGDEEEDIVSLGADLLVDYNDNEWYEMIVYVYENDSKENRIGVHYQLITSTMTTIKQYDKMQKWLSKRKEMQSRIVEDAKEDIEEIIATEEDQHVESTEENNERQQVEEETVEELAEVSNEEQQIEQSVEEKIEEETVEEQPIEEETVEEQVEEKQVEEVTVEEQPIEKETGEEQQVEEVTVEEQVEEKQVEEVTVEEKQVEEVTVEEQQVEEENVEEQQVEEVTVEEQQVEEENAEEQQVEEVTVEEQQVEENQIEEQPIEEETVEEQPIESVHENEEHDESADLNEEALEGLVGDIDDIDSLNVEGFVDEID